jgi:hypothetical protein
MQNSGVNTPAQTGRGGVGGAEIGGPQPAAEILEFG